MSSLKEIDYRTLSALVDFIRGPGFVLDFSDRTFAQFFAVELGVDIDQPEYTASGTSKGKRLRRFMELTDDATAAKLIRSLWEIRSDYLNGQPDPVAGAERKFEALLSRLGGTMRMAPAATPTQIPDHQQIEALKSDLLNLNGMAAQQRGYAFESFLVRLFDISGLMPRPSFRNRGEQIDGSFILNGETYLLEAKWRSQLTEARELRDFEGKLKEKAAWARGLFVSYCGFSEGALENFGRAKRTICLDGLDLHVILDSQIPLYRAISLKARRAAEDGLPFTSIRHLI